jgi:hypothetical protein
LIETAALDINADLTFNGFNLDDARSVRMANNGSVLSGGSDVNEVYVVSGNLYYNNAAGTPIQITTQTGLNVLSGSQATYNGYSVTSNTAISATTLYTSYFINTAANRQITLPAASSAAGRRFTFYDVTGGANFFTASFVPNGTDTIEGVNATYRNKQPFFGFALESDGAGGWWTQGIAENAFQLITGTLYINVPVVLNQPITGSTVQVQTAVVLTGSFTQLTGSSFTTNSKTAAVTTTTSWALTNNGPGNNTAEITGGDTGVQISTEGATDSYHSSLVLNPDGQATYFRADDGLGDVSLVALSPGSLTAAVQVTGSLDCGNRVTAEGALVANNTFTAAGTSFFISPATFSAPIIGNASIQATNNLGISGSLGAHSVASGPGSGYLVLKSDYLCIYTPNGSGDTVTLPGVSGNAGRVVKVKLTANHNTVITTADSSNIDGVDGGSPGWVLPGEMPVGSGGTTCYGHAEFTCDGTAWWVTG